MFSFLLFYKLYVWVWVAVTPKLPKTKRLSSMNNGFKIVRYKYFLLVLKMNDVLSFILEILVYFWTLLIEMAWWGGTDAVSLKEGNDNIYENKGRARPKEDKYKQIVVRCILDGANVNFERNTLLMARLAIDHPLLIKIHCTNHHIEFTVKGTFYECDILHRILCAPEKLRKGKKTN